MRRLARADLLVAAQGVCLSALAWPGRARWRQPRAVTAGALAVALAGTALTVSGLRSLAGEATPFVDPPAGARLRTDGAYAYSRNPVYAGLVLAAIGWAVARRRPEPVLAAAALAGVLHVKVGVEEARLHERFGPDYDAYAARTPRLLGLPAGRAPA